MARPSLPRMVCPGCVMPMMEREVSVPDKGRFVAVECTSTHCIWRGVLRDYSAFQPMTGDKNEKTS